MENICPNLVVEELDVEGRTRRLWPSTCYQLIISYFVSAACEFVSYSEPSPYVYLNLRMQLRVWTEDAAARVVTPDASVGGRLDAVRWGAARRLRSGTSVVSLYLTFK